MAAPARVEVDTSATGLLARFGHDVRLAVQRFEIELVQGVVQARFALDSLRVVGTLHAGRCDASAPSPSERAQIERTVREEILPAARFGEAMLHGRAELEPRMLLKGELSLCGRELPLEVPFTRGRTALSAEVVLVPSRFGIAPYKALGGALKVADRVVVRASLPFDDVPGAALLQASARWHAG